MNFPDLLSFLTFSTPPPFAIFKVKTKWLKLTIYPPLETGIKTILCPASIIF